jgi:AmiR/NasT family two-component response regulator
MRPVVVSSASRRTILSLETALESNRQIGIAVGVIMATHRLTPERSFEMLRLASMNHNRKLRDIAESVVMTGTLDLGFDREPARRRLRA